jgi:S1-C subfamily serine protease
MRYIVPALFGVLLAASSASAQDSKEERVRRLLERIEKALDLAHARLVEDVERIVREEIRKAREGAKAAPPPAAPGKRPYLGISAGDLTDEERKTLGIGGGIRVADVQGPAAKAGLRAGDILLSIGGDPVTEETIVRILERHRPGDTVDVTLLRGRRKEALKLTLGDRVD